MFLDKEQKMSFRSLAFAAAAALALTTAFVPAVEARPPGPPHGGGPGWHRPPPPPHFGPRFHHHRHYGWLWAPAIAGATIWGLSTLYDDPYVHAVCDAFLRHGLFGGVKCRAKRPAC